MSGLAWLRAQWARWTAYRTTLLAPDLQLEVVVTVDAGGGVRAFWTKQVSPLAVCNVLMTAATAIASDNGFQMRVADSAMLAQSQTGGHIVLDSHA